MRHPRRYLLTLTTCLVSLQAADFCLTWLLLASGLRDDVYEANPLALSILSRFGWLGLAGFKAACSMAALTAVLLVSRRRFQVASRLLLVLCLVMAGVVGYSGALLAAPEANDDANLAHLASRSHELTRSIQTLSRLDAERTAISRRLIEGRTDLSTAVEEMRRCIDRYAPLVTPIGRNDLPDSAQTSEVAAYLFFHTTRLHAASPHLSPRLDAIAEETSNRYPEAPLYDIRTMKRANRLKWRSPVVVARN